MDDRTLLELAARAGGLKARYFEEHWPGLKVFGVSRPWNPLTDDGDAFRLMAQCNLRVTVQAPFVVARRLVTDEKGFKWPDDGVSERAGSADDIYAATRRAITRAAAAIAQESVELGSKGAA